MKFSSKVEKCELSPVRKFNPCAAEARAKGRKIYHLNIGQPDIKTPEVFFEAVSEFRESVLEYAPAPGRPVLLEAIKEYFAKIGISVETNEMLITTGGGEALDFVMACILDDGDELLVPEPFYANYNTFARMTGGTIRPIPTTAESGYRYADRSIIEPLINEHTRGIMITNPGNPTGVVLTDEEMQV
ncbi:MAG: aminotransferase class I/II-fold pyridoxal phosphate-dependent enzyme, partial [Clostridia bacterium]|nr:aminotransferase class I/II-fold pyridoxal phosphate-dependent enzyme [Clostridia bacterium]